MLPGQDGSPQRRTVAPDWNTSMKINCHCPKHSARPGTWSPQHDTTDEHVQPMTSSSHPKKAGALALGAAPGYLSFSSEIYELQAEARGLGGLSVCAQRTPVLGSGKS